MAHPFAGQAQSSLKRRLRALNATAGKSWGSSKMYKGSSLPKKNAGSSTPMTISGGSSRSRADRLASGGAVSRKRRGHSTTNIIISHAGGQGGTGGGAGGATAPVRPAMPVPVPRPVPVPAGAAGPGPAGPAAMPPRPPMAAPAGPPVGAAPAMPPRPPMAGPPPGAVGPSPGGVRPPGMAAGGAVKKAAKGGFLRDGPGKSYPGFPHSPTTKTSSAVSAHKKGGVVGGFKQGGVAKRAGGGSVRKLQAGGTVRLAEGGTTPEPQPVISDQVVAGVGGGGLGPDSGSDDQPGKKQYSDVPKMGGDFKGGGGVKKYQFGGGAMGSSFGSSGQPQQQQGGLLGPGPGRGPSPAIQGPPTISGRPARPAMPLTVPQPPTLGARLQRPAPGMTVGYKGGGDVKGKKYRDWGKGQTKKSGGSMSPRLSAGEKYHQQGKGYADGGSVHGAGSAAGRLARNKAR